MLIAHYEGNRLHRWQHHKHVIHMVGECVCVLTHTPPPLITVLLLYHYAKLLFLASAYKMQKAEKYLFMVLRKCAKFPESIYKIVRTAEKMYI